MYAASLHVCWTALMYSLFSVTNYIYFKKIFNKTNDNTPVQVHYTHLLNFVLFHVRYKLKQKSKSNRTEIKDLMSDERSHVAIWNFVSIIQHIVPSIFKWFLQRILRQKWIYIFSQGCWAKDADTFICCHFSNLCRQPYYSVNINK